MTEGIDGGALEQYLRDRLENDSVTVESTNDASDSEARTTLLCTISRERDGTTRSRELTVRMESPSVTEDGLDIADEHALVDSLVATELPVAEPLWFESDAEPLGSRLFVSETLPGRSYHVHVPSDEAALRRAWNAAGRPLPNDYVEVLSSIHDLGTDDVDGLEPTAPAEAVERELRHVEQLYDRTDLRFPIVDEALRWLHREAPEVPETTLVHGDLGTKNLLIEDDRITGVVDWHLARETDPMFDLGYACCELNAGREFEVLDGMERCLGLFDREWLFDRYEAETGRPVDRDRVDYWRIYVTFVNVAIRLLSIERYNRRTDASPHELFPQYLLAPRLRLLLDSISAVDRVQHRP